MNAADLLTHAVLLLAYWLWLLLTAPVRLVWGMIWREYEG